MEREVRQITDSRVLAAMAHPLRRRLLDVLKLDGPSTVSVLADRTGQAVANVSHHLKVLGASGLVEPAPELARDQRERWWRLGSPGVRWSTADFADDPAELAVAQAATSLNLDRQVSLIRNWYAASDDERAAWDAGPFSVSWWLRLTPEELAELGQELTDLLNRWSTRETPDDGQRREPVFLVAHGVPAQP